MWKLGWEVLQFCRMGSPRRGIAYATVVWAAACGGGSDSSPAAPATPVASITLAPDSSSVGVGDTLHLAAAALDAAGHLIPGAVIAYASSDPSLATVSGSGTVSGQLLGNVRITATAGQKTASVQLQVTPDPLASLGAGVGYTCALTDTGKAYCWGSNNLGQLGNGSTANSNAPVPVAGNLTFIQLSVGSTTACGVTTQHAAFCWGSGTNGQLGNGAKLNSSLPVQVTSSVSFKAISAGYNITCGLSTAGAAWCWGGNSNSGAFSNTLGTGDTATSSVPRAVAGNLTFRSISAGLVHACGVTTGGTAECWGNNAFFQLGTGDTTRVLSPTQPKGAFAFVSINAGSLETCATTATGDAYCWGFDSYGSLGAGVESSPQLYGLATPGHVAGPVRFTWVRPGSANNVFDPTCGLTAAGIGYCWGSNDSNQLTGGATAAAEVGNCFSGTQQFLCAGAPVQLQTTAAFKALAPGAQHVCGITTTHSLLCWGHDLQGELGDGTNTTTATPVVVVGGLRMP